ncbi:ligand-binding sensor domain-containing protein [Pseudoduganella lurida]|uniref:Ligand-binding sensor domain-containing protein n=1 Tax=Pseudoduganella lurida TaxID=1036180 RepID=A0A562RNM0_9BURK|nr:hypothetical protein [Pseudoduganella lurida]TWI70020.1 ligand-binding sensor domain-containing protein [Pseudoduganella lurida]
MNQPWPSMLPALAVRVAVCAVMLATPALHAAPWTADLVHAGWSKRDGAPSALYSMSQDSHGLLWFAARDGLYTFDGVRFERIDSIAGNPLQSTATLAVGTFGDDIFVGYQFGGVSVFHGDRVRHYGEADGAPSGSVHRFDRTPAGVVWAQAGKGMYRFERGRWHHLDAGSGLPAALVRSFNILRDGSVLVFTADGVYRNAPGGATFRRVLAGDIDGGEPRPDGRLLINSRAEGMQLYDPASGALTTFRPASAPPLFGYYIDAKGGLWVNAGEGVQLLDDAGRVLKTYTLAQGFTGKGFSANLTDREGNVWFVTEGGIDRVRQGRLATVPLPAGITDAPAVLPDAEGNAWISNEFSPGDFRVPTFRASAGGQRTETALKNVSASYRSPDGVLWFADPTSIWRYANGRYESWPLPPETTGRRVQAMTMARDGTLWASIIGSGLFTLKEGRWLAGGGIDGLAKATAVSLATDAQGRIWVGYPGNRAAVLEGATLRRFGSDDGLDVGNVLAITAGKRGTWFGGNQGLAVFDGSRFRRMSDQQGTFRGVSGIVETAEGELWLHDLDGLARIGRDGVAAVLAGASLPVHTERFNYLDGYEGTPSQMRPLPTLAQGTGGRLWYASSSSIGWIDPAHIVRNTLRP